MIKVYIFQLNMARTIVFCDNLSDISNHIKTICYHKTVITSTFSTYLFMML